VLADDKPPNPERTTDEMSGQHKLEASAASTKSKKRKRVADDKLYVIQNIVAEATSQGRRYGICKWVDYPAGCNTLEPWRKFGAEVVASWYRTRDQESYQPSPAALLTGEEGRMSFQHRSTIIGRNGEPIGEVKGGKPLFPFRTIVPVAKEVPAKKRKPPASSRASGRKKASGANKKVRMAANLPDLGFLQEQVGGAPKSEMLFASPAPAGSESKSANAVPKSANFDDAAPKSAKSPAPAPTKKKNPASPPQVVDALAMLRMYTDDDSSTGDDGDDLSTVLAKRTSNKRKLASSLKPKSKSKKLLVRQALKPKSDSKKLPVSQAHSPEPKLLSKTEKAYDRAVELAGRAVLALHRGTSKLAQEMPPLKRSAQVKRICMASVDKVLGELPPDEASDFTNHMQMNLIQPPGNQKQQKNPYKKLHETSLTKYRNTRAKLLNLVDEVADKFTRSKGETVPSMALRLLAGEWLTLSFLRTAFATPAFENWVEVRHVKLVLLHVIVTAQWRLECREKTEQETKTYMVVRKGLLGKVTMRPEIDDFSLNGTKPSLRTPANKDVCQLLRELINELNSNSVCAAITTKLRQNGWGASVRSLPAAKSQSPPCRAEMESTLKSLRDKMSLQLKIDELQKEILSFDSHLSG
jgi:hypothetical protein